MEWEWARLIRSRAHNNNTTSTHSPRICKHNSARVGHALPPRRVHQPAAAQVPAAAPAHQPAGPQRLCRGAADPVRGWVGGWTGWRRLVCHSIPSPFSLPPSRSYTPHHTTADTSCTHYDAFRFFAPEARALNVYGADLAKRRPGQIIHEQPGCLHAGMGALRHVLRLVSAPFRNLTTTTTATSKRWHLLSYPSIPYPLLSLPHHRPLQMGPEAGALRTVGPGDGSPAPGGAVPRAGYARVPVRFAGA